MNLFEDGLVIEDKLPLLLEKVADFPGAFGLSLLSDGNENLLRALMTLHEGGEGDDHDDLRQDIRRLDVKLQLLTGLVSDLLLRDQSLPAPVALTLGAQGLACPPAGDLRQGDKVLVSLFLEPTLPKALKLYAEVLGEEGGRLRLRFHGLGRSALDWLDKLIFRHHRRSIAQSRAALAGDEQA